MRICVFAICVGWVTLAWVTADDVSQERQNGNNKCKISFNFFNQVIGCVLLGMITYE